jgi:hypothetical protein
MTAPHYEQLNLEKAILLEDLAALNADIRRLGAEPLITERAAAALPLENLRRAVATGGDQLVTLTHQLRGMA